MTTDCVYTSYLYNGCLGSVDRVTVSLIIHIDTHTQWVVLWYVSSTTPHMQLVLNVLSDFPSYVFYVILVVWFVYRIAVDVTLLCRGNASDQVCCPMNDI